MICNWLNALNVSWNVKPISTHRLKMLILLKSILQHGHGIAKACKTNYLDIVLGGRLNCKLFTLCAKKETNEAVGILKYDGLMSPHIVWWSCIITQYIVLIFGSKTYVSNFGLPEVLPLFMEYDLWLLRYQVITLGAKHMFQIWIAWGVATAHGKTNGLYLTHRA